MPNADPTRQSPSRSTVTKIEHIAIFLARREGVQHANAPVALVRSCSGPTRTQRADRRQGVTGLPQALARSNPNGSCDTSPPSGACCVLRSDSDLNTTRATADCFEQPLQTEVGGARQDVSPMLLRPHTGGLMYEHRAGSFARSSVCVGQLRSSVRLKSGPASATRLH